MPNDFELDATMRIVRSRGWGQLTDADLLGHRARIQALFERGELDGGWAQIADFTEVADVAGVTSDGVRRMAEANPWPSAAIRVLVVPTDVSYGLGRMYQMLGEPKTEAVHLTRTVTDAEALIARERERVNRTPRD